MEIKQASLVKYKILTDTQTSQKSEEDKNPKMMRKGSKKAKQTARKREYDQYRFAANFIWQKTTNKCTNQPSSEH